MNEIKCTLYKILRCENISRNNVDETAKTLVLSDPDDLDECVFMNSSMFKKIFGRTWNSMSQKDRLLPIVKISYGNDCIYRRYRQCSAIGLNDFKIGLTQRSISLLNPNGDMLGNNSIIISIGEEHNFFENHPNHATRMSYKMSLEGNKLGKFSKKIGVWSLIFGVSSLIVSVVSIVIAICYS